MAPALRFSVLCLPNVPWDVLEGRVVRLEQLGIEVVGVADHFVDWSRPQSPWFESWTVLTGLASATSTIRVSSSVTQIPLRNPAMLARAALTLDHVSHGRLEIGLGTGITVDPSYGMIGIPNWEPGERVARFAEYLEIVDRLLREEVTTFAGRFYTIAGAQVNPRPVQSPRPPITVAALGPVMMRYAARHADNWNSISYHESFEAQLEETRHRAELMDEYCAAIGRDPATLRRSYLMFDAAARPRGGSMAYYESVDRFEEMASRVIELGFDEVGLYHPLDEQQVPTFERIATDVLPRLRAGQASA
jgi:alkanesulfonate monooxygenase SsuD/methylene tetrahydromethanopterin reductase-like flavin-dependent oxidoreductase (luciferase family)